jgi:UDPglucose 6-dehydrogenase|tara:strand:+ start:1625 stop:2482 length:858 start_codon:yes stop_codon:yes gene_type:complete
MSSLRLGIVGHGFVGKAMDKGFDKEVKKLVVDPIYGTNINDLVKFKPEIIFVCVPTPMNSDGSQDSSIVEDIFKKFGDKFHDIPLVLKSTILPDKLKKISEDFNNLIYNPEFLREKFAEEDFINSPFVILGGEKLLCEKVKKIYKKNSDCLTDNYIFTDIESASLIKYTINSFLASKVIFFNHINEIFEKSKTTERWENFISYISMDERIGASHMMVPGHDGKKGFGGACFTKDTAAMLNYSNSLGADFILLNSVIQINNSIRNKYESLDQREIDQNVNYEFENK